MKGMNVGRIVLGGVVAGLVINAGEFVLNVAVIGNEMTAAVQRLNLPPIGRSAMAGFTVLGFALGIGLIGLYAAIRPRFGAGPGTALVAGAAVYFFAYLYPTLGLLIMQMFPARLIAIGLSWGLVEVLAASLAGAYFYQEQDARRTAVL